MQIGATFSHKHLKNLNLDPLHALGEFKSLGFSWIRLACYWDEIEQTEKTFDFQNIDPIVDFCGQNGINILMNVGMKAPRWPEYYFPDWLTSSTKFKKNFLITKNESELLNKTTFFIQQTVIHFKNFKALKVWQIENEPLDPSGKMRLKITPDFLSKEVNVAKSRDKNRKILINVWANELSKNNIYTTVDLADIIGLDLYLKTPIPVLGRLGKYIGPRSPKEKIKKICDEIKSKGKNLWITELQAEPWEPGEIISKKENPPSFATSDFEKNINFAKYLNPQVVFLWGFEYWYLRKINADTRYWNEAERIIKAYQQEL